MKDRDFAAAFLARFAYPLASGGVVSVGMPLLQKGADRLLRAAPELHQTAVGQSLHKAQKQQLGEIGIVTEPRPLADDPHSLLLLSAIHDALFLFHPRGRTLSQSRRDGLLQQVRLQLIAAAESLPEPSLETAQAADFVPKLTARYSLLSGLWALRPKSGEPLPQPQASIEHDVLALPVDKAEKPLWHYLGLGSPLTQLLRPPPAPLLGPELVPWLQVARIARLFVTVQLRHGSTQALSRIGRSVEAALEANPDELDQGSLRTLIGLFALFHLRVATADGPPLAVTDQQPLRESLSLFAALASVDPALVFPPDIGTSGAIYEKVQRHRRLCQEVARPESLQRQKELCKKRCGPRTLTTNPHTMDNR